MYIFIKMCVVLIEDAYILCVENHDFQIKFRKRKEINKNICCTFEKNHWLLFKFHISSIGRRGFLGTIVPELHETQYFLKVRALFAVTFVLYFIRETRVSPAFP